MRYISLSQKLYTGIVWKFLERFIAQLVSTVVSIILARLLTPDEYGIVGITVIFFNFANVFATGGLTASLIQKKDADEKDYSSVFWVCFLFSTVLYFILFACAPLIENLYKQEGLKLIVRIMSLSVIINAIGSVVSAYAYSTMQFKKFFWSTLVGTVISGCVGVYMAYNGYGVWALIAQQMINPLVDMIVLWVTIRFRVSWTCSLKRLKALWRFGFSFFITSIISVTYDEIFPLVIGIKYTTSDLAFYEKGRSFPSLINATVNDTFSSVTFSIMAKMQDSKEDILFFQRKFMSLSTYVIFPCMLGFLGVSENFVRVILNDNWISIVPYLKIFCIIFMFNIIQTGNLQVIKSIGRSDLLLKMEIIKKSLYLVAIIFTLIFADKPISLAYVQIIITVIAVVVNTFPNKKLIGYNYKMQIEDVYKNLSCSVIMMIVVLELGRLVINRFLLLTIQIVTGVLIYVGASVVLKNENLSALLSLICKKGKNEKFHRER